MRRDDILTDNICIALGTAGDNVADLRRNQQRYHRCYQIIILRSDLERRLDSDRDSNDCEKINMTSFDTSQTQSNADA